MPEEELRRLLERLQTDEEFRERIGHDTQSALSEFDLSYTERVALASNDEDALRRLAGAQIDIEPEFWKWVSRHICTWIFCGPPGTRDWQCRREP